MNKLKRAVWRIYLGYKKKLVKYTKVETPLDHRNDVLVSRFINRLEELYGSLDTISEQFLIDYFLFQFNYWQGKETVFKTKAPLLAWCVGQKAVGKWRNKSPQKWRYFATRDFKNPNGIINEQLMLPQQQPYNALLNYLRNNDNDELQRRLFFNSRYGLLHCVANAVPYVAKSQTCIRCRFAEECKEKMMNQLDGKTYRKLPSGTC